MELSGEQKSEDQFLLLKFWTDLAWHLASAQTDGSEYRNNQQVTVLVYVQYCITSKPTSGGGLFWTNVICDGTGAQNKPVSNQKALKQKV